MHKLNLLNVWADNAKQFCAAQSAQSYLRPALAVAGACGASCGAARLAVFRAGKVFESADRPLDDWKVSLAGLNLDSVWENVIGGVTIAEGSTLDEQIAVGEERAKTLRRIDQLEKKARTEKQPRRKWELAEEAKKLKYDTEVHNG
jgi:hypothetical protein